MVSTIVAYSLTGLFLRLKVPGASLLPTPVISLLPAPVISLLTWLPARCPLAECRRWGCRLPALTAANT